MATNTSFARLLADAVARSDETMAELAAKSGLSRSDLYNWVNGRCKPNSFARVEVLAAHTGLRPRDLLR